MSSTEDSHHSNRPNRRSDRSTGSVTTWGDPACGGNSAHVAEHLKSRAFQLCYNEWAPRLAVALVAFRDSFVVFF